LVAGLQGHRFSPFLRVLQIQPLYEKLNHLNRDLGAQLAARKQLEEQKNASLYERAELTRKKDRLEAKVSDSVGIALCDLPPVTPI
jgi:hypothetical protein